MKKVQILYPADRETGQIHHLFREEAEAMHRIGFIIGTDPADEAEQIIKRGFTIKNPDQYPADRRMIQGWEENIRTLDFSLYAEIIRPLTIPFEITDSLTENQTREIMTRLNWDSAFIKSKNSSLFAFGDLASVFPATPIDRMLRMFEQIGESGPYIIREYIADQSIFFDEERFWVLNGTVYHPSGKVPDHVSKAAKSLWEFSGSRYFVIDAAGEFIVEVNPGESSDRGGDTPLTFFAQIFAQEFLK